MFLRFLEKRYNVYCHYVHMNVRLNSGINPINMSYTLYGANNTSSEKPPVIIMHGLFGSQKNWRAVARNLEKQLDMRIFTVDARNHGESPHTSEHSSAHMTADIVEFLKNQGIKRVCVMGHSMGGRTAMHLALKHPELVDRAIIVDISPISMPRDRDPMNAIIKAMQSINVPANLSLGQGRKLAEHQIIEAVGSGTSVDFLLMNLGKRENGEFYWIPNLESLRRNLGLFDTFLDQVQHLPPYQGPVMFICGNQSNFVDPNSWPAIQTMFPNSELHWLDAGHLVHFDQPEKFINLVAEFLKR